MNRRADDSRPPGRWGSARVRILAAFVILLALSELASVVLARQILQARVGERVDDSLAQEVEEFRRLVEDGNNPLTGRPFGGDVQAIFDVFLMRNVPAEGEAVYTFLGREPYRSSIGEPRNPEVSARLDVLARVPDSERGDYSIGDERFRYLAVPVNVRGERRGAFIVTSNLGREEDEVTEAVQVSAGIAIAVLLLASGVAWVVAGRILGPLRELTDTAQSISETDLTRRIDARGNDEIAELARTFNGMLDRLEAAFASQRAFVSDAGHELRTPITIIRGHLELLGDDPDERRETVELVTDELDRMSRFVDDLLTLAKAERSDFLRYADVDLDVLAEELLAKASGLADRLWSLVAAEPGRVTADRQRLTQAAMNLAHNAVQYTQPDDAIEIGGTLRNGEARIWVRDSGPGIAPADRERVFERFARAGGAARRSDGAGLGLAIVKAIAEAHGGRVELESEPGWGATFTIVVPTTPPEEAGER